LSANFQGLDLHEFRLNFDLTIRYLRLASTDVNGGSYCREAGDQRGNGLP
jgi:hypothetical protein